MDILLFKNFLDTPFFPDDGQNASISKSSCKLEVRYRIWPLSKTAEEYEIYKNKKRQGESFNIITESNRLYLNIIQVMYVNISSQTAWQPNWFESTAVSREFGVDAGMLNLAIVNFEFGKGYKYCMIHALHLTMQSTGAADRVRFEIMVYWERPGYRYR